MAENTLANTNHVSHTHLLSFCLSFYNSFFLSLLLCTSSLHSLLLFEGFCSSTLSSHYKYPYYFMSTQQMTSSQSSKTNIVFEQAIYLCTVNLKAEWSYFLPKTDHGKFRNFKSHHLNLVTVYVFSHVFTDMFVRTHEEACRVFLNQYPPPRLTDLS